MSSRIAPVVRSERPVSSFLASAGFPSFSTSALSGHRVGRLPFTSNVLADPPVEIDFSTGQCAVWVRVE